MATNETEGGVIHVLTRMQDEPATLRKGIKIIE